MDMKKLTIIGTIVSIAAIAVNIYSLSTLQVSTGSIETPFGKTTLYATVVLDKKEYVPDENGKINISITAISFKTYFSKEPYLASIYNICLRIYQPFDASNFKEYDIPGVPRTEGYTVYGPNAGANVMTENGYLEIQAIGTSLRAEVCADVNERYGQPIQSYKWEGVCGGQAGAYIRDVDPIETKGSLTVSGSGIIEQGQDLKLNIMTTSSQGRGWEISILSPTKAGTTSTPISPSIKQTIPDNTNKVQRFQIPNDWFTQGRDDQILLARLTNKYNGNEYDAHWVLRSPSLDPQEKQPEKPTITANTKNNTFTIQSQGGEELHIWAFYGDGVRPAGDSPLMISVVRGENSPYILMLNNLSANATVTIEANAKGETMYSGTAKYTFHTDEKGRLKFAEGPALYYILAGLIVSLMAFVGLQRYKPFNYAIMAISWAIIAMLLVI